MSRWNALCPAGKAAFTFFHLGRLRGARPGVEVFVAGAPGRIKAGLVLRELASVPCGHGGLSLSVAWAASGGEWVLGGMRDGRSEENKAGLVL